MGLTLARSITGSVHELFAGTERVRRGDFTPQDRHPLARSARRARRVVQLDDVEHRGPAAQKAEKERMEQELRIARSIQMSLLPQGALADAGPSR